MSSQLFCILLNSDGAMEGHPFAISFSKEDRVTNLRDKVKDKVPNRLRHVEAHCLKVWICIDSTFDYNDKDTAALEGRIREAFTNNKCYKLSATDMLADVKEDTVFVKMPGVFPSFLRSRDS